MSDFEDSTVAYIAVSSPFGGLSDIGFPGVSPPPPDFVPKPVYPEFMPPEDEILPTEDQTLSATDSPTTDSPGYIPESDPEEDLEEDDDEDPEEDLADYPADGGDDGDDEDEPSDDDEDEPSNDDEGEEVNNEADDEEEEEHPALADSTAVALPAIDQALSAEETELFKTDDFAATPPPHPAYRITARISISAPVPTPVWSDAEIPFPPLPLIPSPSLPLSPPLPVSAPPPASPIRIALSPGYEVEESSSAAAARPARGLRADYGFVATMDGEIRRDLERDVGYGITDSWDEIVKAMQGTLVVTDVAYTASSDYKATGSRPQEAEGDYRDAGGRSQEIKEIHKGTEAVEEASDSDDRV
ncbi:hypothetical protein Tco_1153856 [Tanacetum coccineum]